MQGASRKEEGRCTIKGRTENRGFLSRREGNRSERFRVCSEVHGARVESREPTAKRKATQITGGNQREYHRHKAAACGQGLWDTDTSTGECRVIFMYFVHSAW